MFLKRSYVALAWVQCARRENRPKRFGGIQVVYSILLFPIMEIDHAVHRALDLIHGAALSPPEHRLFSRFVSNSVGPKVTALYVIQRVSGGSGMKQDVDLRIRHLLAD